jgi:hypothetical protein
MKTLGTYPDIFKYQDRELFISKRDSGFNPMFICSVPEIAAKYGVPFELCVPDTVGVNYNHIHLIERSDGDYHLPLAIHDSVEYLIQWRSDSYIKDKLDSLVDEDVQLVLKLKKFPFLKKVILFFFR